MTKKSEPVKITVATVIRQDGREEKHHFEEMGQVLQINGVLYIRYQEHTEEGERVPVTYKIEKNQVRLTRFGETHLELHFEKGKRHSDVYRTQFGPLQLSVLTDKLECQIQPDLKSGSLNLKYQLFNGGNKVGDYLISLQFSA